MFGPPPGLYVAVNARCRPITPDHPDRVTAAGEWPSGGEDRDGLVIGVTVTKIAVWGRRHYAIASRRAGYLDGINNAVRAVAAGGSAAALIDRVSSQLAQLLSLRSCVFRYSVAGLGRPAQLHRDGSVTFGQRRWAADGQGLPPDTDVKLPVEGGGGNFQGRFLRTPARSPHSNGGCCWRSR
jgi:hypothetical protein